MNDSLRKWVRWVKKWRRERNPPRPQPHPQQGAGSAHPLCGVHEADLDRLLDSVLRDGLPGSPAGSRRTATLVGFPGPSQAALDEYAALLASPRPRAPRRGVFRGAVALAIAVHLAALAAIEGSGSGTVAGPDAGLPGAVGTSTAPRQAGALAPRGDGSERRRSSSLEGRGDPSESEAAGGRSRPLSAPPRPRARPSSASLPSSGARAAAVKALMPRATRGGAKEPCPAARGLPGRQRRVTRRGALGDCPEP